MKKIILYSLFIPLFAMQCEDEKPCGELIEFNQPNLISVENSTTNFQVNDVVVVSTEVNRFLYNENITYDLFQDNTNLACFLNIEKESAFNQNLNLQLNPSFVSASIGSFEGNILILEKENTKYRSKIAISLLEKGTYKLQVYTVTSYNPNGNFNCEKRNFSLLTNFASATNEFIFNVL